MHLKDFCAFGIYTICLRAEKTLYALKSLRLWFENYKNRRLGILHLYVKNKAFLRETVSW